MDQFERCHAGMKPRRLPAMSRRNFLASLSASLTLAQTGFSQGEYKKPANRNIKWALSEALWHPPLGPFTDILDVMQERGFIGIRVTDFPNSFEKYGVTKAQMQSEFSKRGLHVVTISWNGHLQDPAAREQDLDNARTAMKFLADFGANHLVVFSPSRRAPGADTPAGFKELCERCNQIGEIAGEMGFTAGLHNHMGQMVQTQEEVDRFMSMTDPKLFGLSPDTSHLNQAGCDVVGTLTRYKNRIHMLDYKDAKWTPSTVGKVEPNGSAPPTNSARVPETSSQDLGDQQVDYPSCHRILKSVNYHGWIVVDLDRAPLGPMADYKRCGDYIVNKLEPIYL
jgi:sugar phosphate isomerase/epimerase